MAINILPCSELLQVTALGWICGQSGQCIAAGDEVGTMASMPWEALADASPGAAKPGRQGRAAQARAKKGRLQTSPAAGATIELVAAVMAVASDEPMVDVLPPLGGLGQDRLPSVRFALGTGQSLEETLRAPVHAETGRPIGYLQQLQAFLAPSGQDAPLSQHVLIGYLALVHDDRREVRRRGSGRIRMNRWQGCYQYLPWEDWRGGRPAIIENVIVPRLMVWARRSDESLSKAARTRSQTEALARLRTAFGSAGGAWDVEKVLMRYDLLAEAGLIVEEAIGAAARPRRGRRILSEAGTLEVALGRQLVPGHRCILAAAIGRLRADLRARPVVFELMRDEFSLFELQRTVEAILGPNLHKQNFRRLIETTGLVEPTGRMKSHTGGRPAKLYRFRRDVLLERPAAGPKTRG